MFKESLKSIPPERLMPFRKPLKDLAYALPVDDQGRIFVPNLFFLSPGQSQDSTEKLSQELTRQQVYVKIAVSVDDPVSPVHAVDVPVPKGLNLEIPHGKGEEGPWYLIQAQFQAVVEAIALKKEELIPQFIQQYNQFVAENKDYLSGRSAVYPLKLVYSASG